MKLKWSLTITFCVTLITVSCLKKQNLEEEDLGPAIEPNELTMALGKAHGLYDFNLLQINEFNSYVISQRIQDSYTETIEQQDLTLKDFSNTSENLTLNVISTKTKYLGGQSSLETREWTIPFSKSSESNALINNSKLQNITVGNFDKLRTVDLSTFAEDVANQPYFMFQFFQSLAFYSCYNSGPKPESCHRLKVEEIQFNVPYAAYSQHNCTSGASCTIPATKIEFDVVLNYLTDKDGQPKRIHYTIILSQETPFLSRMLQFCSRTLYDIRNGNQKILADLCYNLNNYAFGSTDAKTNEKFKTKSLPAKMDLKGPQ